MYQIRLHGRGGQGVATAAEMLSVAALTEGHFAQAFPSFGSEWTCAAAVAFARVDDAAIRCQEPIQAPDVRVVQDPSHVQQCAFVPGLHPQGYVLINSEHSLEELGLDKIAQTMPEGHVRTVPATRFAMQKIGRPLPGAAMLSGYAAMTGQLKLESVQAAYAERFSGKVAEANAEVARLAYEYLTEKV